MEILKDSEIQELIKADRPDLTIKETTVKYHLHLGKWSWYVISAVDVDTLYCIVNSGIGFIELGYTSIQELRGLGEVVRDGSFSERNAAEVMEELQNEAYSI